MPVLPEPTEERVVALGLKYGDRLKHGTDAGLKATDGDGLKVESDEGLVAAMQEVQARSNELLAEELSTASSRKMSEEEIAHAVEEMMSHRSSEDELQTLVEGSLARIDQVKATPMDEHLSETQLASLETARQIYEEAGGCLDKYARVFLMRFLVAHKWSIHKAEKQLRATAKWRKSSGAEAIRAQLVAGTLRFASSPHALKHCELCAFLPLHGTALVGDVLSYFHVGTLQTNLPQWLADVTDVRCWLSIANLCAAFSVALRPHLAANPAVRRSTLVVAG